MDTLAMNIKREFFAQIAAKTKRIEYRDIKTYWTRRLASFDAPFLLRLSNGMTHPIPELTIVVTKVEANKSTGQYELHLGRVRSVKRWDPKTQSPRRR